MVKTIASIFIFLMSGGNLFAQNIDQPMAKPNGQIVFMTDFGMKDRFVASMKGVAVSVDSELVQHDLTHQIDPFNIWEAAYTLAGTIPYWPGGTVFVSVVDPGVGTDRRSVVAETTDGKFIVTPDNGTLTLIDDEIGFREVRMIDESINRRPDTDQFATFHGRDLYAFTGARLASGVITFEETGPEISSPIEKISYKPAGVSSDGVITGTIMKIEHPYGNPATNIPAELFFNAGGDKTSEWVIEIVNNSEKVFQQIIPFVKSFGYVNEGDPLLYVDSLGKLGIALNGDNFAEKYEVKAGPAWQIKLEPAE